MSEDGEIRFVSNGLVDHLYNFPFASGKGRYFNILINDEGHTEIEYLVPSSVKNRVKITITFINESADIKEVTLKRWKHYKNDGWVEQPLDPGEPFKFNHFTFEKIAQLLAMLAEHDLVNVNARRFQLTGVPQQGISPELASKLRSLLASDDGRPIVEQVIMDGLITSHDIVNLGYRKQQLAIFKAMLQTPGEVIRYAAEHGVRVDQPEKAWQHFFKANDWIFGFGLDYRYLGILQEEAEVGHADLGGRDVPTTDFLAGTKHFTVLVELKLPTTNLFGAKRQRSNAWKLSGELYDAVSQVLEQKASWQAAGDRRTYTRDGGELHQRTIDPKAILVIGSDGAFEGETPKERDLKLRTFELFRRDTRNLEVITYTELYERAEFIVEKAGRGQRR